MTRSSSIVAIVAMACLLPAAALADDYTWDGGGGDDLWNTASNWDVLASDPAGPPTSADVILPTVIGSTGTHAILNGTPGAAAQIGTSTTSPQGLYLDISTDLTIEGDVASGTGGTSGMDVNQTAGNVVIKGGLTLSSKNIQAVWNITGGTLDVGQNGDGGHLNLASSDFDTGFILDGGTVNVRTSVIANEMRSDEADDLPDFQMISGDLTVNGGGNTYFSSHGLLISHRNSHSIFEQTGGNVNVTPDGEYDVVLAISDGGLANGHQNGEYRYSGGTLNVDGKVIMGSPSSDNDDGATVENGTYGNGIFTVIGSGTTGDSIDVDGWESRGFIERNGEGRGIIQVQPDASGLVAINVDGDVEFEDGAELNILDPLYTPTDGDTWTVMNWTGTLTQNGGGLVLSAGSAADWTFNIDSNSLTIMYGAAGPAVLLGDANNDGVVSADDFAAVQTNFGNTGAADGLLPGDANDDGVVSADDFAAIQTNFGNVLGAGAESTPVPEPTTMALLALSSAAMLRRRRLG